MQERWKFDKRLRKRNLRKGDVTEEEYNTHLSAIADAADNATSMEVTIGSDEAEEETAADDGSEG